MYPHPSIMSWPQRSDFGDLVEVMGRFFFSFLFLFGLDGDEFWEEVA